MITRAHVMPYLNQHVVVRTHDGQIHHGILHSVTNDGIYVRPMRGNVGMANAEGALEQPQLLLDLPQDSGEMTEAWFPFLFFPWWGIGGFWPGFWW